MGLDKTSLPAPTTEELEGFQQWVHQLFPHDFVSFLRKHNGYRPEPPIEVGNHALYRFTPLLSNQQAEEHMSPAEWATEMNSVSGDIDGRFFVGDEGEAFTYVPIAELSIGDYLCLDYSQPGPPGVAVWNHEESERRAAVAERIADSFTDFMNQIGLNSLLE